MLYSKIKVAYELYQGPTPTQRLGFNGTSGIRRLILLLTMLPLALLFGLEVPEVLLVK
jgi:hypothetical protein